MASDKEFVDFVVDQMGDAGLITSKKMFGEYALYCDGKVIALICDNQLFVKPTGKGRIYIGKPVEAPPYPGAKLYFLVEDKFEDRDWISQLICITAQELSDSKENKPRKANKTLITFLMIGLTLSPALCSGETNRPTSWATPIALEGIPNLHKVTDSLYRSAQPEALGMQNLTNLGIRTVINLRSFHSDEDKIKTLPFNYERIWMKTWHPEREDMLRFLQIVTNPTNAPVLVHCQHGADRTGMMCAIYRIVVQGWTKKEAIREMTEGGFGFHEIWGNLPKWIDGVDVESLKLELKPH